MRLQFIAFLSVLLLNFGCSQENPSLEESNTGVRQITPGLAAQANTPGEGYNGIQVYWGSLARECVKWEIYLGLDRPGVPLLYHRYFKNEVIARDAMSMVSYVADDTRYENGFFARTETNRQFDGAEFLVPAGFKIDVQRLIARDCATDAILPVKVPTPVLLPGERGDHEVISYLGNNLALRMKWNFYRKGPSPLLPWTGPKIETDDQKVTRVASIATDPSNNVYLAGREAMSTHQPGAALVFQSFLKKFSPAGDELDKVYVGRDAVSQIANIATDRFGNLFVIDADMTIVKYSKSGAKLWANEITCIADGPNIFPRKSAVGLGTDRAGNVYVLGSTQGTCDGTRGLGIGNYLDMLVAKYDPEGTRQWTQIFGGFEGVLTRGLTVTGSGNLYVSGTARGFEGRPAMGRLDQFVMKLNSEGIKGFVTSVGVPLRLTYGKALATDANENVFFTSEVVDNERGGTVDAFVTKLSSGGSLVWRKSLPYTLSPSNSWTNVYRLAVDHLGAVIIAGSGYEGGGNPFSNFSSEVPRSSTGFVRKLNSAGDVLWMVTLGDALQKVLVRGLDTDGDGSVFIAADLISRPSANQQFGTTTSLIVKYNSVGRPQ